MSPNISSRFFCASVLADLRQRLPVQRLHLPENGQAGIPLDLLGDAPVLVQRAVGELERALVVRDLLLEEVVELSHRLAATAVGAGQPLGLERVDIGVRVPAELRRDVVGQRP